MDKVDASIAAIDEALANLGTGPAAPKSPEEFFAYLPQHQYIFRPTRELWRPESVNACVPAIRVGRDVVPANRWLDQNRAVEQMSWIPGKPEVIENIVIDQGGVIARPGMKVFNLYRAPAIINGDARMADKWRDLLNLLWPEEAEHLERWFAQRIQSPHAKVNHALVMAGDPGIGKDTLLEPIKANVGAWNWQEISPSMLMGRFTGWAKAVVVRVSEVRDLGDVDRYAFHEHTKVYAAAPPDVLRIDEKNLREHYVPNVLGLLMTTNHPLTGLYLPADDRRHFVAASKVKKEVFDSEFFPAFWHWYEHGGHGHVGDYLRNIDLSGFDPKAPPPRTTAFEQLVMANAAPEDGELFDLIEALRNPLAFTVSTLVESARDRHMHEAVAFLTDMSRRRQVPHRLADCGYELIGNPARPKDGRWSVCGRLATVYVRRELARRDQILAARALQESRES